MKNYYVAVFSWSMERQEDVTFLGVFDESDDGYKAILEHCQERPAWYAVFEFPLNKSHEVRLYDKTADCGFDIESMWEEF